MNDINEIESGKSVFVFDLDECKIKEGIIIKPVYNTSQIYILIDNVFEEYDKNYVSTDRDDLVKHLKDDLMRYADLLKEDLEYVNKVIGSNPKEW